VHEAKVGRTPYLVAADAAFYSARNEAAARAKGVKRVCIPNRSTKSKERGREQKKRWFKNGQKGERSSPRMMVLAYAAGLRLSLATVAAKDRNEVAAAIEVLGLIDDTSREAWQKCLIYRSFYAGSLCNEHIIFGHVLYRLSYLGNLRAGRRAAVYRGWVGASPDARLGGPQWGSHTDPGRSAALTQRQRQAAPSPGSRHIEMCKVPGVCETSRAYAGHEAVPQVEERSMRIRDVLADKGGHVVTVWPDRRLDHVTQLFDERAIASVVVVDHDGRPVGLFTDRELVRALARFGVAALELPVGRVMLTPAPWCRPDNTVSDVLRLMTDNRVRHVLVLQDTVMVGIVSIGDLVKIRLDDAELENRVLREMALARLAT
jgi:CBS domain-containing protein